MDEVSRRALLRAGRTSTGERLLEFYARHGLVPEVGRVEAEKARVEAEKADTEAELERVRGDNERLVAELQALREDHRVLDDLWDRVVPALPAPTFDDLTEDLPDTNVPPLDRADVDEAALSDDQRYWREHGYLIKKRFIPDELLDRYWDVRSQLNTPHGWTSPVPYMFVPEVRDLAAYLPLEDLLEELIGEPMAVNLNLTGTITTERNWHQDDYLNPPNVNGWYAAVWFAVDDIDPDSGPFQYVRGSHRWPALRRDRVRRFLRPDEREAHNWPKLTERFLDELIEKEIASRGSQVQSFIGEKGDILIWHSRLIHRGSFANVDGRERRGFISHYTGLDHWSLGPNVARTNGGGLYFIADYEPDHMPGEGIPS